MREIFYMTKRNCLIYLRDKSAVFFSMLSMLIVLGLMVIFLGRMNSDHVVSILSEYGGQRDTVKDEENAVYLIQMWTLAGILVVNAVTITLTVLGSMVQDETKKRLMAFYVTPVKRLKLTMGYVLSAWIIGTGMCILTLAVGEIYFVLNGYELLPIFSLCKLCGMIALNTFTFSALGYLMALFIHSDSAWSGMLTVIGTLVGFVGGIYLPMAQLSEGVQKVLKALPVLHGASMMRVICTKEALEATFEGFPEEMIEIYKEKMGITVNMWDQSFGIKEQVLFLAIYATIGLVLATLVSRKRKLKDR